MSDQDNTQTSSSKLAPHHNIFMANLESSPTKDRNTSSQNASSSRVIESLHDQIDMLTKTNLQLTTQSQNLLSKLELAQSKESKLLENLNLLKNENENLNSIFERKNKKLKELEKDYSELSNRYNEQKEKMDQLSKLAKNCSAIEQSCSEKLQNMEVNYNSLLESQNLYRDHYSDEISKLNEKIGLLELELSNQNLNYGSDTSSNSEIELNLNKFNDSVKDLKSLETEKDSKLSKIITHSLDELNLQSWLNLYQTNENLISTFAEKMDLKDVLKRNDEKISNKGAVVQTLKKNVQTQVESNNADALSSNNAQDMLPIKMVKLRKTPNTNDSSSNGNSSNNKRRSFYTASPLLSSGSIPKSASPVLPGVKRTASARKPSSSSSKTNVTHNNDPSTSPTISVPPGVTRTVSSTHKKKRNSMVVHGAQS
ncbi:BFH_HP2_G0003040.mRNA.1.CDS.1 [Saccharomyces cerevisiae]|nr:BFH_HP2_G0003040.mRNA.1.CDS.1 [Saccharomyces cerevisiae]CAI6394060.1 BFH_HP2_G0003040.mRNA.1.CDS.1 [Saccharomyces cerevisiae]CAI6397284.1 BFH_HP1_G0003100.mRNA.1.CDS.1 [Saccharomyces cerevisiae]